MKKLLLIAFLFIGIVAKADNLLVIEMKDASKVTFNLEEKPTIHFSDDKLLLESEKVAAEYNLNNVLKFYFTKIINTDTENIKEEIKEIHFSYFDEVLDIEGIEENDIISIYNISGKIVDINYNRNSNNAKISLRELPKGIYIVKVSEKHTIKILK